MIVVDTNVLAYLLIQGERTEACRRVFQRDPEWCVPFLWRSGLRNVLAMHMRHGAMPLDGALRRMAEAEKLVEGREYSISSATVLECVGSGAISACAAEFVCLARKLNVNLVTTDKRVLKDHGGVAVSPEDFALRDENDE